MFMDVLVHLFDTFSPVLFLLSSVVNKAFMSHRAILAPLKKLFITVLFITLMALSRAATQVLFTVFTVLQPEPESSYCVFMNRF